MYRKFLFLMGLCTSFLIMSLVQSTAINGFDVRWNLKYNGIGHKVYEIEVQNLDDNARDFDLSVFFNETSFNLENIKNVYLYEWKDVLKDYPIYGEELIERTCHDEIWEDETNTTLISNESYDCSYYRNIITGYVQKKTASWKPTKMQMVKYITEEKEYSKSQPELMNIPKYDSKEKTDDFGIVVTKNGIKKFKLEFDVPIVSTEDGWGNSGLVAFMDEGSGSVYHPWWNTNYGYRYNISTNGTVLDMPYSVNDTDLINGFPFWTQNSTGSIAIYCKILDCESGDIAIANETDEKYWENANTTEGNSPTLVWDKSKYISILHAENTSFLDSSQHSNSWSKDGSPNSVTGIFGNAINISEDNDAYYIDDADLHELGNSSGNMTISVWLYPTATSNNYVFSDDSGTFLLYKLASGKLNFIIYEAGGGETGFISTTTLETNEWYHVVITTNGSHYYAYINGTRDGTAAATYDGTIGIGTGNFAIGVLDSDIGSGSETRYNGYMDEIWFLNYTVSDDWVKQQYYNGIGNYSALETEEVPRLTECNQGGTLVYEFWLYDERNLTQVNSSLDVVFDIIDVNNISSNYSFSFRNQYNYSVCFYPAWTDNITVNATMDYWANDYEHRSYYYYDGIILNQSNNQSLYLISDDDSDRIIFTIKDAEGNIEEDVYVKIQRYYINTNTYRTIAIGKSDYLGQFITYLESYDVWYKFILEQDGTAIQNINPMKIAGTEITLMVEATGVLEWFKYHDKISSSCSFSNVTENLVCTATDTSGYVTLFCLNASEIRANESTNVCGTCDTSSAVTLTCALGNITGKTVHYVLSAALSFNPVDLTVLQSDTLQEGLALAAIFGLTGVLMTLICSGTSAFIGLWRPSISIILLVSSLAVCYIFGIITLSWSSIVGIALVGGIIIYKLRK